MQWHRHADSSVVHLQPEFIQNNLVVTCVFNKIGTLNIEAETKLPDISQTTFANAFSWMKIHEFW